MLVIMRQISESIVINDNIVITLVDIRCNKARLGIEAPIEIPVHRKEIHDAIQREKAARGPEGLDAEEVSEE